MTTFKVTDIGPNKEIDRFTIWFLENGTPTGDYIATNGYPSGFYQHGQTTPSVAAEVIAKNRTVDISTLPTPCYLNLLNEFQEEI